ECWFELGSSGEGDWKSWVRWWIGEKWRKWSSRCLAGKTGVNSVSLNRGREKDDTV
nr:hypothetical protein [Tanacetum cinerariifolium]